MIETVVLNSNVYALQKNGKPLNTNVKEIEQVIGMFLKMGLVNMPNTRMYWETETRYPPVADIMSRNRFMAIISSIHFVDNLCMSEEEKKDKLWKIRPWISMFREKCLELTPEEFNSVDEQMVPFKGKFSRLKQYMRNKPHKWGFKIWSRCGISCFHYDFDIYQGSGGDQSSGDEGFGVSGNVVLKLCSTLPKGKNFKVTADDFFTSIPLIVKLQEQGILYPGTARGNRLPDCNLKDDKALKKEGRGCFDYRVETTHQISAVRWYDNKAVTLVSSYVGPEPTSSVERWDKSRKEYVEVRCPGIVKSYNNLMGGVDFLDSLIAKYRYRIRSRRWYLYLFWHTITTALGQAWILYRKDAQSLNIDKKLWLSHRHFQADVAGAIIMQNVMVRKRGRPSAGSGELPTTYSPRQTRSAPSDDVRYDGVGHLTIKVEKRGRCTSCPNGFTNTYCGKCKVRLCFTNKRNCFKFFHEPRQ